MHEFYLRLNQTEKEAYLNAILGDDDDESDEVASDSDGDWLPNEILPEREALDSDESGVDNQEIAVAQEIDAPSEEGI